MNFYDVIESRKSIKKFKTDELDRDKLIRMIDAAMMSPSWKNRTPYKFIFVDRDNVKQDLANAILNKSNVSAESVLNAPLTAVIVAEPDESGDMDGKDYYLVDSAIAMEHFILAATEEGYGTCWIGAFDENKVKQILGIPNHFRVVAMTPVGKIHESELDKPHHPKKDVRDFVYLNKWNESFMDQNVRVLIRN